MPNPIKALRWALADLASSAVERAGEFGGKQTELPLKNGGRVNLKIGSPPLDMSFDARMARAREQGFDVDTPLYRGMSTPGEFRIDDSIGVDHQGPGISASPDVDYAHVYARSAREGQYGEPPYLYEGTQPTIYPLIGRGPYVDQADFSALRDRLMKERGISRAEAAKAAQYEFRKQGYTGWKWNEGSEVRVWPDEDGGIRNLRSRFAAFDPAKKDSKDLLAQALLGAGIGAGGLAGAAGLREALRDRQQAGVNGYA